MKKIFTLLTAILLSASMVTQAQESPIRDADVSATSSQIIVDETELLDDGIYVGDVTGPRKAPAATTYDMMKNSTVQYVNVQKCAATNKYNVYIKVVNNYNTSSVKTGFVILNADFGHNTAIGGTHSFSSSYSNCTESDNWFVQNYKNASAATYVDNPYGNIKFTFSSMGSDGYPIYRIQISNCYGYTSNSGSCVTWKNQGVVFAWDKTVSVHPFASDGETRIDFTDYYTISVSSNNNSYGTVSGGGTYAAGAARTLTASVASSSYQFLGWKKNGGSSYVSTSASYNVTVNGNDSYVAEFAPKAAPQYTITTAVSPSNTYGTVTGAGSYYENNPATLTATSANEHLYIFDHWLKDGNNYAGGTTITPTVTANATYTAVFRNAAEGTITGVANYGTISGTGHYTGGSAVTLTVTPNSGYKFAQWSDGNEDNPRTVYVDGDATYTAQFTDLNQPLLASFSWDDDDISVEQYGDGNSLCNSFYAPYGKNFYMLYAKANSRSSKNYLNLSIQSSQSQMWGDLSFFKVGDYPVVGSSLTTNTIQCDGDWYSHAEWFWSLDQTNVCVAYGYDSYALGLNPLGTYLCDKSGDADDTSDQSNYISVTEGMTCVIEEGAGGNPYIRLVRNSDQQCMVSVGEAKPKYNVSITAPENGTITVSYNDGSAQSFTSGSRSIEEGTELTVTTTPAADYHFGAWTNDGAASVTVDEAKTIGATFAQNDYFLNATYGTGGASVTRDDSGNNLTVKRAGNTVTLTPTAATGYNFLAWGGTDAAKISNNVFTFPTNGTHNTTYNVQATFQAIPYGISYEGLNGATNSNPETYTIESNDITLVAPGTRTGYTFANWTDDDNSAAVVTGIAKGSTGDRNFTATWTANSYDITYKDKDNADYSGSNLASLPATHTYNTPTNLVAGVKSGYNFLGWYDNDECTGDAITSIGATAKTAAFTLYAKWELAATYSSVTFTAGEHGSVSGAIGVDAINSGDDQVDGSTITLTATPDNFYSFVEWRNASKEQVSTNAEYSFTLAEAVNLTAVFALQETIELTDNFENGSQWQDDYAALLELLRAGGKTSAPKDVRIIRTFKAGRWSTFSLPFGYSFQKDGNNTFRGQVYYLISAEYKEGGYLTLNCMPNTYRIEANKPYILIPDADIVNPVFENVKLTEIVDNSYSASDKNGSGSVIFRNTQYRQIIYNEESSINKRTIYLSNNRLYYPGTTDMYMNAFRGYFYMDYENIFHSPARIRLMNDMGEQIETLPEGEEETSAEVKKYIENGILVIERGGVKYDAQGHKLN